MLNSFCSHVFLATKIYNISLDRHKHMGYGTWDAIMHMIFKNFFLHLQANNLL